ncbi:iron uptake system protein EfeO [Streptococcus sp. DD12]|uniref:iron uptake system protein EfeO n=1 Tax=Streptococcus sp. DD12 TaxID=1777880 RepID=UPI0007927CD7|nr:iron uptake system protein EfeO [Streptococcus sp. DD12]KXT76037.1 Ferrous iron transport periplasmic protein EfeO [Streptococcus sp. DD12]
MKKLGFLLIATALVVVGCSKQPSSSASSSSSSVTLSSSDQKQLDKATAQYKTYVEEQIAQLLTDTETFRDTLKAGNIDEAKKQYPLIRMSYERSEPLAESFSELDERIDSRLVDYKKDNQTEDGWRGFHKIEQILWEQNTTNGTADYADQLVNDVKELKAKVATLDVTPQAMLTGAVDLLNEVADSKITGEEEIYSHTDLYDFRANIEGAQKIYELLRPLIQNKDKSLVKTLDSEFKTVNSLLDKHMTDDKHYKSFTELTQKDTKELSEAVAKLGEPLSQMGIILNGN